MLVQKNELLEKLKNGLTYDRYMADWENEIDRVNPEELEGKELNLFEYKKLNLQRTKRVHKTFKPDAELIEAINRINLRQYWMVLTENWCGDSAQNLPYLAIIAKLNSNIELRILKRDENLEIMDMYLTNGKSRSIPKLVTFDENGNEIFQWGPRPVEAQRLVEKLKSEGLSHDEFVKELHLWYGRDKGNHLVQELKDKLNSREF